MSLKLQQYLPLAVLKPKEYLDELAEQFGEVATVPTACGIETINYAKNTRNKVLQVATVPTACGIETLTITAVAPIATSAGCNSTYRLRY